MSSTPLSSVPSSSSLLSSSSSGSSSSSAGGGWTWKQVALGAAGVLVIGISSYGIYSVLFRNNTSSSKSASNKSGSKNQKSNADDQSESSTKTALETAIEAKNRGNKYFKGREYVKAIECYKKALELVAQEELTTKNENTPQGNPVSERATFHHNLAAAYEKMNQPEDVIRECSACLDISAKYVKALLKRGKAYKVLGKLEEALFDITAVAILEELKNVDNLQLSETITRELSELKAKEKYASKSTRSRPSSHFIKSYFESFTFDIFDVSSLVDQESGDAENNESQTSLDESQGFGKAKKLFEQQQYEEVEDACSYEIDTVGKDSPFYLNALLVRGSFRLLSGSSKLAIEDLEKVITSPKATKYQKSNALIKRGSLNMQNQENFNAMRDFEESVEVADDSVDAHHHRGQLYLLVDDMPKCMEEFEKCIKLNAKFEQPRVQLCYAKYKVAAQERDMMKASMALEEFKAVLKQFPKSSDGYAMYAQALADSGQPTESLQMFDKAIDLCPQSAANYVHKGMLLLQLKGDYNSAIDLIKQALEKDPKNDFSYEMLGTIEIKRGDYGAAAQAFESAIDNARFEVEMSRLYFLYLSAIAWKKVKDEFGVDVSSILAKTMAV